MYFKTMPKMTYPFPDGRLRVVRDIFTRVATRTSLRGQLSYESYEIKLGETPDIIAQKKYKNSELHWLIFLANNITNPYEEWPKDLEKLDEYVKNKYGAGNETAIHHYKITGSDPEVIVDYDAGKIASGLHQAVTNYDYEIELNDSKRQIFLLKSEFAGEFVTQYKRLMAANG